MPELPEVETTRRGIEPHLVGHRVPEVVVRETRLRQPVSPSLERITGDTFTAVRRRAKYLILDLRRCGSLLVHLGMSGSLRLSDPSAEWRKHDHLALRLDSGSELRFHDPRRFGIFLHLPHGDPLEHPLLAGLGPEPLGEEFTVDHLAEACAGRKAAIKQVVMDPKVVVGVGNIYASESLFLAGIRPGTAARRLTRPRLGRLMRAIREVPARSHRAARPCATSWAPTASPATSASNSSSTTGRANRAGAAARRSGSA